MGLLVLVRHGESTFNRDNKFTGRIDAPLTEKGREEARVIAAKLKGIRFDKAYCSSLRRSADSLSIILASLGQENIPIIQAAALDERRYGDLEGLNKAETERKFGRQKVRLWRRSYEVAPPGGESLKDTAARTVAYLKSDILPEISRDRNVLVVAHGNSLRSIVMELDGLTPDEVVKLDISTGQANIYELGSGLSVRRKLVMGILCLLLQWPSMAGARDLSGLQEFPSDLLHGAREEVRPEGILTLLTAGAGASIARYGKTTVIDDFHVADTVQRHVRLGKRGDDFGAAIGYPVYLMAAMGTTYFAAWRFDAHPAQEFGLLGFEALSLAGIQTLILKASVDRLRPDNTDRSAFPSGHTSASFSLATVAASQYGWKVGVPAYLLAGFVGYTRVHSRSHYFSDVLFGAGLGIASGRAVYKVRRHGHPDRYTFAPFVSPGGGGVTVFF